MDHVSRNMEHKIKSPTHSGRRTMGSRVTRHASRVTGFTLIEVLISITVFTTLMLATVGIYTYTVKAQRRTIELNRIQREAQFILEVFAKRVRSSGVDYEYYGASGPNPTPIASPVYELALLDKDRVQMVFRSEAGMIAIKEGDSDFITVTSQSVLLRDLKFYIEPAVDPFTLSNIPDEQPKVTIVMEIASVKPNSPTLVVQQSVPQRTGGF